MAERVAGGKIGGIGLLLRELTWAPIGIFVLCEVRPNHTPSLVSLDLATEFMFDCHRFTRNGYGLQCSN